MPQTLQLEPRVSKLVEFIFSGFSEGFNQKFFSPELANPHTMLANTAYDLRKFLEDVEACLKQVNALCEGEGLPPWMARFPYKMDLYAFVTILSYAYDEFLSLLDGIAKQAGLPIIQERLKTGQALQEMLAKVFSPGVIAKLTGWRLGLVCRFKICYRKDEENECLTQLAQHTRMRDQAVAAASVVSAVAASALRLAAPAVEVPAVRYPLSEGDILFNEWAAQQFCNYVNPHISVLGFSVYLPTLTRTLEHRAAAAFLAAELRAGRLNANDFANNSLVLLVRLRGLSPAVKELQHGGFNDLKPGAFRDAVMSVREQASARLRSQAGPSNG